MVEVTYICGHTGKQVVSDKGLPLGWVVPTRDLSQDVDKSIPENYTVIAFSSEKAMKSYADSLLQSRMMSVA